MPDPVTVPEPLLRDRMLACLQEAGADAASAGACTRALLHASRLGIDSHGVRLVAHYAAMMRAGRVNPRPRPRVRSTGPATAMLHGDNGLGHAAAYAAVETACGLARACGIGAVGVVASSHCAAVGAYAVDGADAGFVTMVTTNGDSVVAPHAGTRAFHGTNPIAAAAPVPNARPWLMEFATSSIPFNRIALARAAGTPIPDGTAADSDGVPTSDPARAEILLPLGGTLFGYKGAGLAGLVTVLSAVLTGGTLDHVMRPMFRTDDFRSPRNLGHFCLAIDPDRFVGRAGYAAAMSHYVTALRAVPAGDGARVLVPGDREWEAAAERSRSGIPIDAATASFLGLQ